MQLLIVSRQARKFGKHIFEIAVDPKGPPSGPTFWLGLEARVVATPIFPPKVAQK